MHFPELVQSNVIRLMKLLRASAFLLAIVWSATAVGQDGNAVPEVVIKTTVSVIDRHHLQKPTLDQEFCALWFDCYLKMLVPTKLFFLNIDISDLKAYLKQLPKFATNGNAEFFELVNERFKIRVRTALKHVIQRIGEEFDFSVDEEIQLWNEQWPLTNDERLERWRLQLKYDLLVERSNSFGSIDPIRFLKTRYWSISKQVEQLTEQLALGLYLDEFCRTGDLHSGCFTEKEFCSFMGGKSKVNSIGLRLAVSRGHAIIHRIKPMFQSEPAASKVVGCELLAVVA
ncbi:MAG: carboxyl-terminal processing protease [Mariniblastus sp.]|jgi:carboxyl-terminal processing protease